MRNVINHDAYFKKIEDLRFKMIDAAKIYGMNHPIVLQYSQKLDHTHNELMMITHSASHDHHPVDC